MVTILKPPRHCHAGHDEHIDIASEELPGNADEAGASGDGGENKRKGGVELSHDSPAESGGTGSAPGEGPNPTV